MRNRRSGKLKKFLQARLSPEGNLGLHLTVGIIVLVVAAWLFSGIAEDVVNGDSLILVDVRFSAWLQTHPIGPLTKLLLVITNLHGTLGISIMTLVVSVLLWRRRFYYWALTIMLSVFGGMLLNVAFKNMFQRPRPHFDNPILTLTSYGFPSGHTMMATVFYGSLCTLVVSRLRRWPARALAVFIAILCIALVGFSRIYLGAHYLSDVLGAMAEGLAWLALCLTATETVRHWRIGAEAGT